MSSAILKSDFKAMIYRLIWDYKGIWLEYVRLIRAILIGYPFSKPIINGNIFLLLNIVTKKSP